MKHLIPLLLLVLSLSSCGAYKTYSGGLADESYIIVLREGKSYDNVVVVVDGKSTTVQKIYKVEAKRKALPIVIEPGKHTVQVNVNGKTISNETVFIGLRETKQIILR
ncbi:MAG: hypothetical protein ACRCZY_02385 [Phocaeicola sp.]